MRAKVRRRTALLATSANIVPDTCSRTTKHSAPAFFSTAITRSIAAPKRQPTNWVIWFLRGGEPEVLEEGVTENSREERYANTFGRAFMTPARAVMQKFKEITVGSEKLTRRHVIVLAHFFGVSREAIVRRLEELKLAKSGTWDWFQANGGISDQQAIQMLGDLSGPDIHKVDADRPTTLRLGLLAGEAWRRGILSEGQLARMLHLDRVELRRMFDGLEIEGSEADGALMPD